MKRRYALTAVFVLLCILLASCGLKFNYAENGFSNKDADGMLLLEYSARYPIFGGSNASGGINAFLYELTEYDESNAKSYQTEAAQQSESGFFAPYELKLNVEVVDIGELGEKYVSLRITDYAYLGGAHGSTMVCGAVFDAKTGERLTSEQILGTESGAATMAMVRAELERMIAAEPESYFENAEEYLDDALMDSGGFYIDTDGSAVFPIQEYEIAPYASGTVYVRVERQGN